jgi:DNA-3-methyladenine glycosylase II
MVESFLKTIQPLTEQSMAQAVRTLALGDEHLAAVVRAYGPPPFWVRDPGFGTLILIILEQQVSLASARAAYTRLEKALGRVSPSRLLTLNDSQLKRIGFSRQKMQYARLLATAITKRRLRLSALTQMQDEEARRNLLALKGIGPWSADIYLLMALRRPDVWPTGDLALAVATRDVKRLRSIPGPSRLNQIGQAWHPWRAVAARILWHHYLSTRRKSAPQPAPA